MATDIKLELHSTDGAWTIFNLVSFGAEVERKVGPGEFPPKKKVWASLETPKDKLVLVAIPQHPGAGPQPDQTHTMAQVHDFVSEVLRSLEWALDDIYGTAKQNSDQSKQDGSW